MLRYYVKIKSKKEKESLVKGTSKMLKSLFIFSKKCLMFCSYNERYVDI